MHKVKIFSVLFEDTEPTGSICGCRRFVDTRSYPIFNDLYGVSPHSRWNRDITHCPWGMRHGRNFYRREILLVESTSLGGYPGKGGFMFPD